MLEAIQQYKEGHPTRRCVFIGATNVHNTDLIHSTFTDKAGMFAQEFCELFGLTQLMHFPTRGPNALDLVLSDVNGKATVKPGFGNSDHESMHLRFQINVDIPPTPIKLPVRNWGSAPWPHIKGDIKRALASWKPTGTVDEAEDGWNCILTTIIENRVKWKTPKTPGPTPWWDKRCEKAHHWKSRCFDERDSKPDEYRKAVKFARKIQRKAYSRYQQA